MLTAQSVTVCQRQLVLPVPAGSSALKKPTGGSPGVRSGVQARRGWRPPRRVLEAPACAAHALLMMQRERQATPRPYRNYHCQVPRNQVLGGRFKIFSMIGIFSLIAGSPSGRTIFNTVLIESRHHWRAGLDTPAVYLKTGT